MKQTTNDPVSATRAAELRNSLRRFAISQLPEALVPAHFVIVPDLPRLPNGKVDRKRLPAVGLTDRSHARYVPPGTPVQRRIAEIWSELLGVPKIGIEDNFFALGGDSLSAVQMVAKVREEFGQSISLRGLFERPTIAELAAGVAGVAGGGEYQGTHAGDVRSVRPETLLSNAELPADVVPEPGAAAPAGPPYESVLLTGATGFVGAFLLSELLERSCAVVRVLVRTDEGEEGAARRAHENLSQYGLWRAEYQTRLVGVPADLGRPYFGMSHAAYRRLADDVEMVVHNGSWSSFVLPYQQLMPVNVFGTTEILRLACRTRIKPVHYVSSLAVLPGHRDVKQFYETRLTSPDGVVGGYPQTKWVAERLVTSAADRGLPVAVYRPGQITGAQRSGIAPPELFVCAMMKSCIQLGLAPNPNMMVEMVPVDYVAAAVIRIALTGRPDGDIYHLPSPKPVHWTEMFDMLENCGYPVARVSYQEWYAALNEAVQRGEDNALRPFLPLFGEDGPSEDLAYQNGSPYFDAARLTQALNGTGITCPPVNEQLLSTYLNYFISIDYLSPPTHPVGARSGASIS